ncbi:hypothetical protein FQN57_005362 [Myotisia sp. PD_48]|nr:hypothetical protein FQN57_005362 [Myotisia sp. PD_48]
MEDDQPYGIIDPVFLDKIDRLFACNVGQYVSLPQLVVVGDQSSGKSSVLEGLTGIPFPRDCGLCTRFATQIIFRRSAESQITASIIPHQDATEHHKADVLNWTDKVDGNLDADIFRAIMINATEKMGIGRSEGEGARTFSRDILCLEVCGPTQEHFSIIDVPGIFKRTTQGVTTKEDRDLVDNMVRQYMENPRSVMLTVIPSNVDIVTQEILERAEEVDPDGVRTLGVLTKPDLVDRGAESAVIDLIEGKSNHKLLLGWHLLRNPGQAQDIADRSALESQFFNMVAPWNGLNKERTGISALRVRLQGIMADHIRREFPKIVALARSGEYHHSTFFDDDLKVRLATFTVNRGEIFAQTMAKLGHDFDFSSEIDDGLVKADSSQVLVEEFHNMKLDDGSIRTEPDHEDIEDLVYSNLSLDLPRSEILCWLRTMYVESRGFELGTFRSSILGVAMKRQSQKWPSIAMGYISDMLIAVHGMIKELLKFVIPNSSTRAAIEALLSDHLRNSYQAAIDKVEFLLKVEREGSPATHNQYFKATLEKCRQKRLQETLKESSNNGEYGDEARARIIAQQHLGNTDHMVLEVHDILRSYYAVACKRFVDCVRMQAVDYLLINGPNTPAGLFSPEFVAGLDAEQLEQVVGESPGVKRRRQQLEKEIKQLEDGKKILILHYVTWYWCGEMESVENSCLEFLAQAAVYCCCWPAELYFCATEGHKQRSNARKQDKAETITPLALNRSRRLSVIPPYPVHPKKYGMTSRQNNKVVENSADDVSNFEQAGSPFFTRLPPEIRRLIYLEILGNRDLRITRRGATGDYTIMHRWKLSSRARLVCHEDTPDGYKPVEYQLPILKTCRRIYKEAIELLYSSNDFIFSDMSDFRTFVKSILPRRADLITSVKFLPKCLNTGHGIHLEAYEGMLLLKRLKRIMISIHQEEQTPPDPVSSEEDVSDYVEVLAALFNQVDKDISIIVELDNIRSAIQSLEECPHPKLQVRVR